LIEETLEDLKLLDGDFPTYVEWGSWLIMSNIRQCLPWFIVGKGYMSLVTFGVKVVTPWDSMNNTLSG